MTTEKLESRVEFVAIELRQDPLAKEAPPNPYVAGPPLQKLEQIYGREQEVERIREMLVGAHQDQVVLVLGERRMGKTTLLNALKRHPAIARRYLVFDIDLQHLSSQESVVAFFRDRFAGSIQHHLERIGSGRVELDRSSFDDNPTAAFRRFMDDVDALLKRRNQRLLLLLDEVETLFQALERNEELGADSSLIGRTVVAGLRDVLQKMEQVSFLLAGVTGVMRRYTSKKGERLFKLAVEVECRSLDETAASRLLREPVEKFFEVSAPALDLILRETARQPYLLQVVAHNLFSDAIRRRLTVITRTHVEEVFRRELVRQRRHFAYLTDDLREEADFRLATSLAILQEANRAVPLEDLHGWLSRRGDPRTREQLFERLKRLEERAPQVVERRVGTRDAFRIAVGLYARHLRYLELEER